MRLSEKQKNQALRQPSKMLRALVELINKRIEYVKPALVGVMGFALSASTALMVYESQVMKRAEQVYPTAQREIQSIQQHLETNLLALRALKGFFLATDTVTREEFRLFSEALMDDLPDIQAMEWVPKVLHEDREKTLQKARLDGFQTFEFKEQAKNGNMVRTGTREYYYPALYVVPIKGNESALGFDLASNPLRWRAMQKAKVLGEAVSSSRVNLVLNDIEKPAVLIFEHIYSDAGMTQSSEGFVLAVLRIGDVIERLAGIYNRDISIYVEDITDPNQPEVLFGELKIHESKQYHVSQNLEIAQRVWRIVAYPTTSQSVFYLPWVVFILGVLFSIFIAVQITYLIYRRTSVEKLVHLRTQELENSEAKMRAVLDNTVDGLITIDEYGKVESFNKACTDIFGYKPEEVIGRNIKILMPEPYHSEHDGYLSNYLETGRKKVIGIGREVRAKRKNGETFPVELAVSEVNLQGRKIYSGIVRDISVRKRLEADRHQLQSAMEHAVEGVSLLDKQGHYVYLNEAYATLCGYPTGELLGKHWSEVVHRDDRKLVEDAYQGMLDMGKVVVAVRGVRKDSSIFHKQVTMISRFDDEGRFKGHHCFMSDISDRKSAEEEILRSNIELERFAYVASHDLKEPLRMVVSFTELLSLDYAGQLDDTAKEYIEYARDGALRMQSLVEDLLEYARLGQDAESREVDLNHVMDDVLSNLKDTIAAVGANIDYAELPVLQANPARLLSVLQNLISNAIKYQLPGTVPRVRLEVKYKRNHWEISVEDNGIGMKEEYCQKIFEPFKRLHAKHKYPGTGMGLAICRRIVESFGGKIWAESRLGEGTIFYFTIPQLQAAA